MHTAAAVPTTADLPPPNTEPAPRVLEIRFTGSGSEYFRIWAVNLLFILLSCGLYLPFAKMRRIRYLYANTLIDGEALAFHGDAWKMFRGFVLMAVLMLVYTFAGEFSPIAALLAFVLGGAAWPALWRASMQFRLGNTSWRGLRMGFEGSLGAAYLAYLPVFLPAALALAWSLKGEGPGGGVLAWLGQALQLAALLAAPWSTALIKRYQNSGYRIAGEHSGIRLHTRSVYFVGLKSVMLAVLMLVVVSICTFVLGSLLGLATTGKIDAKGSSTYFGLAWAGMLYLFVGSVVLPYYASRIQNLVWGNTHSASLRFRSELSGLRGLTLKNWLLIVATLGLYRPFAVIATMRLRLESVSIESSTDPAAWVAPAGTERTDASGEVAGDFFGMDVGL
ncbi:YjgN family protein [Roseateles sp. P5_E4]